MPGSPATNNVDDEVVTLGPADLQACCELDRDALNRLWTDDQWRRELNNPSARCLGIRQQGRLAAIACGWEIVDELQINVVAVCSRCRQQGLGTTVLTELLRQSAAHGVTWATLEVSSRNLAARALYEKLGFTSHGTRRHYYSDGSDALIKWLELK